MENSWMVAALTRAGKQDEINGEQGHVKEPPVMALITVRDAATKLDTSPETVEDWIQLGLLAVTAAPSVAPSPGERYVEEDELFHIAETMGWLYLSQQNWDDIEES
jgi:hypothetical protein